MVFPFWQKLKRHRNWDRYLVEKNKLSFSFKDFSFYKFGIPFSFVLSSYLLFKFQFLQFCNSKFNLTLLARSKNIFFRLKESFYCSENLFNASIQFILLPRIFIFIYFWCMVFELSAVEYVCVTGCFLYLLAIFCYNKRIRREGKISN